MKKKINKTKVTRNSKLYVVHGIYDNSGQYHESYYKKFALGKAPDDIYNEMAEYLNMGSDFTALVMPSIKSIFVFITKDRKNKFLQHIGDSIVKELLDSELAQPFSKTTCVWRGCNFTE